MLRRWRQANCYSRVEATGPMGSMDLCVVQSTQGRRAWAAPSIPLFDDQSRRQGERLPAARAFTLASVPRVARWSAARLKHRLTACHLTFHLPAAAAMTGISTALHASGRVSLPSAAARRSTPRLSPTTSRERWAPCSRASPSARRRPRASAVMLLDKCGSAAATWATHRLLPSSPTGPHRAAPAPAAGGASAPRSVVADRVRAPPSKETSQRAAPDGREAVCGGAGPHIGSPGEMLLTATADRMVALQWWHR